MTQHIPPAIVQRLRCPTCGEAITDGVGLACVNGHELKRRDGYIDAATEPVDATTSETFASFGYEWTAFDKVQPEDERFFEGYFTEVDLTSIQGAVGLDAGCGKGRFSRFVAGHLQALVALDGSAAVEAAARNLEDVPNACVLRADLREPPLQPGSFGFISCLGVLHHLSDPETGFRALVRLLAPRGTMLVYLYSRPTGVGLRSVALSGASLLRRVTTRLPHKVTRILSAPIAAVLYAAVVVPGSMGDRCKVRPLAGLPLAVYRKNPLRALWLDTLDRLSAPVETRYTWEEIRPWFERAGLHVQSVAERGGLVIVATGGPTVSSGDAATTSEPAPAQPR